jgi:hypothetical protein
VGVFAWGRKNCPYLEDLRFRGMHAPPSLPPDWAEMHAHAAGGLAERAQARKHTPWHHGKAGFSFGPAASLPQGLPPDIHFRAGCLADSPCDVKCPLPDDLDFAVRTTLQLGRCADVWRRKQIKLLPGLDLSINRPRELVGELQIRDRQGGSTNSAASRA